jgi:hypothetical protein
MTWHDYHSPSRQNLLYNVHNHPLSGDQVIKSQNLQIRGIDRIISNLPAYRQKHP